MKKTAAQFTICLMLLFCGCGFIRSVIPLAGGSVTVTDPSAEDSGVNPAKPSSSEYTEASEAVPGPDLAVINSRGAYMICAGQLSLPECSCLYYESLSESERTLYNLMAIGLESCSSEISVPDPLRINEDDLRRVSAALLRDQPQLFWYGGTYKYHHLAGQIRSILPDYNELAADLGEHISALADRITLVHRQIQSQELTVLETERFIHDHICENCSYENCDHDQLSYGALLEGRAVCSGYARAFQLLCQREGLSCYYIPGEATNSDGITDMHAWNAVMLGGMYYNVDVTWDDQESLDAVFYGYYNVNDDRLLKDHRRAADCAVPACLGTQYSFDSIYNMDSSLANAISASGCDTVVSSLEEYKSLLLDSLVSAGEGEGKFEFISKSSLYEEISAFTNDRDSLGDIVKAAADELGLTGYSFNCSLHSTDYGEGYLYIVESTVLREN